MQKPVLLKEAYARDIYCFPFSENQTLKFFKGVSRVLWNERIYIGYKFVPWSSKLF